MSVDSILEFVEPGFEHNSGQKSRTRSQSKLLFKFKKAEMRFALKIAVADFLSVIIQVIHFLGEGFILHLSSRPADVYRLRRFALRRVLISLLWLVKLEIGKRSLLPKKAAEMLVSVLLHLSPDKIIFGLVKLLC